VFLEAVSFVLLSIAFPNWHIEEDEETGSFIEVKAFPSKMLVRCCVTTTSLSSVLTIVATLWQHVSATTLQALAESSFTATVHSRVGALSTSFLWLSTLFSLCSLLGVSLFLLSMQILQRLQDTHGEASEAAGY
jgi:hypothetical protein